MYLAYWLRRNDIADGHNYGNLTEWKCVSCDKDGLREYTCQNCGDRKKEVVSAIGHNFGEWILSTPPTAVAKGIERRECGNCGKKEYKNVDKLESTVSLSKQTVSLKVGQSVKIDAGGFEKGDYVLKWKNSNPKAASFKKNGSNACTINAKVLVLTALSSGVVKRKNCLDCLFFIWLHVAVDLLIQVFDVSVQFIDMGKKHAHHFLSGSEDICEIMKDLCLAAKQL